jgi:hypothetical protein
VTELCRFSGKTVSESVRRMIDRLISGTLQIMFNRTGKNGKKSFSDVLEPLLKGK